jgi:hypothetical protein
MNRPVLHLLLATAMATTTATAAPKPKAKPPKSTAAAAVNPSMAPQSAEPVTPAAAPVAPPPVAPDPSPAPPAAAPVVAPTATTPVVVPSTPQPSPLPRHQLGIALRVGALVPAGRYSDVSITTTAVNAVETLAGRGATFAGSLQLQWSPPVLGHALAFGVEAGFYPLSGDGSLSMPNDPDFGTLTYGWSMQAVPVIVGASAALPLSTLPWWPERLRFALEAGFLANYARVTTTYTSGADPVIGAPQSGWALGFLAGLEGAFRLGPGQLVVNVRYLGAFTDLGLQTAYPTQPWNAKPGDVQGTNVLAGYRLNLSL